MRFEEIFGESVDSNGVHSDGLLEGIEEKYASKTPPAAATDTPKTDDESTAAKSENDDTTPSKIS